MQKTALVLLSLFITVFVYGQNQPHTLLWKVTKAGNKNVSYLFGTFHEVSPSFFNTLSNAVSKLQQAAVLFVEQRSTATAAGKTASAWTQQKWEALLTKEQQAIFTAFLEKAEDTSYCKLDPLLLSLTMARLYMVNFCEADTNLSGLMDPYIEEMALKEHKQVYSLDSNQTKLLHNISKNLTARQDSLYASVGTRYMKSMLDNNLDDCSIITNYKNLTLDYQLHQEVSPQSADYSLLVNRNNSWLPVLDQAFSANNCFAAVGFRHLFYRQGLIQQLRKLGYHVEPVPVKNEGSK